MTHDPGGVYADWRRANAGIKKLEQEIEAEQVRHIDLAEYAPGSPRLEKLYAQMEAYHQWRSKEDFV
jgi:hypothetical protein